MRIFVANISFTTTEEELERLFESYGIVDRAQIITDRDTGRSRGFAFVEMPDATEAQAAIAGLNGTSLGGAAVDSQRGTRTGGAGWTTPRATAPAVVRKKMNGQLGDKAGWPSSTPL